MTRQQTCKYYCCLVAAWTWCEKGGKQLLVNITASADQL